MEAGLAAGTARAQTTNWTGSTGDWSNVSNWDSGVPTSSDTANVSNGGTAQITTAANANILNITGGSTVDLQSGGALSATTITLGDSTTGGTLLLSSPTSVAPNANSLAVNAGGGTIDVASGDSAIFSEQISGEGALTKSGNGTLILLNNENYSGGTTISQGVLQIGNGSMLGSVNGNIQNNELLVFGGSNSTTYAGVISGTGYVAIGTNSDVGSGNPASVVLTGDNNSAVEFQVSPQSTLQLGNGGTTGSLTASSNIINYSGTVIFDHSNNITFAGGMQFLPTDGPVLLEQAGTGVLTLSGNNDLAAGGSLWFDGSVEVLSGGLSLSSDLTLDGAPISLASNTTLYLTGTDTFTSPITIAGQTTFNIATGTTATWNGVISDGASPGSIDVEGEGTLVLAQNDTYSGSTTISSGTLQIGAGGTTGILTGNIADNGVLAFDRSNDYTFGGVISGAGAVSQIGTGTLTLTGVNDYSGGTSIANGTLSIASSSNLGNDGAVALQAGGTLQITQSGSFSNTTTVSGDPAFSVPSGNTVTWNGLISDGTSAGTVDVTGGGTLVLTNALNSYSGGTVIAGNSTLVIDNDGELGATTGGITLGDSQMPGTLQLNASFNLSATRTITLNYGGGTIDTNGYSTTISQGISGPLNLGFTKAGAGTLVLDGVDTYLGPTTIAGGVLQAGSSAAIPSESNLTVDIGATFELNNFSQSFGMLNGGGNIEMGSASLTTNNSYLPGAFSGVISGSGSVNIVGGLTLSGVNTYTGGTNVNNGEVVVSSDANLGSGGTVALNNSVLSVTATATFAHAVTVAGSSGFNIAQGATATWSSLISDGSSPGSLQVTGGGTFAPTNASNSYSGGTTVIDGSTLALNSDGELGAAGGELTLGNTVACCSTGSPPPPGTLQFDASFNLSSSRSIVLSTSGGVIDTNGYSTTISQVISGDGVLTKSGAGTLTLAGSNTYDNGTDVTGGTLSISTDTNLGGSSEGVATTVTLQDGTSLDITGSGTFTHNLQIEGNTTIDVPNENNAVWSGTVSTYGGSLTKSGTGILTLTGTNYYTGNVSVNAGTLTVTSSLGGAVTVNSGATLSGTGTIGATTVNSGGTLAPGGSAIGTLTVEGNLSLASGSTYAISSTSETTDLTTVSGSANIAGTLLLSPSGTYSLGQQVDVLTATGGVTGAFSGVEVDGSFGTGLVPIPGYDGDDAFVTISAENVSQLLPSSQRPTNIASSTSVASAIDNAISYENAYTNFEGLYVLSASNLEKALSQMSGEPAVDAAESAFELNAPFMDLLTGQSSMGSAMSGRFASTSQPVTRLAYNGSIDGMPMESPEPDALNLWGTGYGEWDNLAGNATLGTHGMDSRDEGFAAGVDYRLGRHSLIGAAIGVGQTTWTANDGLGGGHADAVQFGLYGTEQYRATYISLAAAYASYFSTTDRDLALGDANLYHGHFDANSEAARIEIDRRIRLARGMWVGPYIAGLGQFYQMPAYAETTVAGSPSYALSYAAKSQSDITHDIGMQFDQQWRAYDAGKIDFNIQAGWVHQYAGNLSDEASFTSFAGTEFTAYGTRGPKDAARLSLGGTADLAEPLSLGVALQTLQGGASKSYGGSATLNYRW